MSDIWEEAQKLFREIRLHWTVLEQKLNQLETMLAQSGIVSQLGEGRNMLLSDAIELKLCVRTRHLLVNAGIGNIPTLVTRSEEELLKIKGFGRKALNEVKDALAEMELRLGMSVNILASSPKQ